MSEVAHWLAKLLWRQMLRFMRLNWVRRIRRRWLVLVPASTAQRMIQQDRFARRHGLAVLTFSLTLMLASFAITGCYYLALLLANSGMLGPRFR